MGYENVQGLFHQAAEQFGANIAIDCVDKQITYGELDGESNNLANHLISTGISKGSIIAILARDPIRVITAIIGILKAGCVFVPLDPNIPAKRLAAMAAEVLPQWWITESTLLRNINDICVNSIAKVRVVCLDNSAASDEYRDYLIRLDGPAHFNAEMPVVSWEPDDMCYVFFTSGSTGKPKGIAGRLAGINHFVKWEIDTFGVNEGTRVSQLTTPSFDAVLRDIFVPLCAGGTVCVPPDRDTILSASRLIDWLDRQHIHLVHCVPSLFRSIVNQQLEAILFSSLRYILLAGEPLLPADVGRWMDIYGERIQLVNLYGPSETTMVKFFYFVQRSDRDRRSIPIGKPMEGTQALVLGANGKPCPPGTTGEIYIRTPFCTLGYYNRPKLTKEVFVQNPFSNDPSDVVYKTGDLGRVLEDGNFEFLGRKDQQVKVRGIRIELGEIEGLLRSHECVQDVAVVDREDLSGNKYLCAYVVLEPKVELGALGDFLSMYLPDYMIPSLIVPMDVLPRTLSGKLDRRALPVPASLQSERATTYVAPRTPLEQELADMWTQLLGVGRVGIHDRFFDLGGHSLLATQVLSRLQTALGVEVPLRIFLEEPTIASLAMAIVQMQAEQEDHETMARMIEEIRLLSDEALEDMLGAG